MPVGARIAELLESLGQTPAWLAERSGFEKSTISRILHGQRTPSTQTLAAIAPWLGVSLDQLVEGTEIAKRVTETAELVARSHYEGAVRQMIQFERAANIAEDHLRAEREIARLEAERRRDVEARLEVVEKERDEARRVASRHEEDARRYGRALEFSLADIARLKTEIVELGKAVSASRRTGRITTILAGAAAVASAATYLTMSSRDKNPGKRSGKAGEK